MIVDTHCHLDDNRYKDDLDEVLDRANSIGVKKFIIPAADPRTLKRAFILSQRYENIYFAVGVHPYDADVYDRAFLERFIGDKKCVAVGECGLDYYRLPKDNNKKEIEKELQKRVFIDQIELSIEYNLPLIVHIREASIDSFNILDKYRDKIRGVLHCYNAHSILLNLQDNFYYGIGGVLTFKNARKLVEIYPKIPQNRLLIETDAPYLTPHPHRGKRNEPSYTELIALKMAELSNISKDEIEDITTKNALNLFSKMAI
ncbi:MAG: TatD family hydrolase [Epsilonproteobacteria bacterium]|jgi:TatD DNase family protein|nr:TatD family hydrolase [Campylobacterota bacterium]